MPDDHRHADRRGPRVPRPPPALHLLTRAANCGRLPEERLEGCVLAARVPRRRRGPGHRARATSSARAAPHPVRHIGDLALRRAARQCPPCPARPRDLQRSSAGRRTRAAADTRAVDRPARNGPDRGRGHRVRRTAVRGVRRRRCGVGRCRSGGRMVGQRRPHPGVAEHRWSAPGHDAATPPGRGLPVRLGRPRPRRRSDHGRRHPAHTDQRSGRARRQRRGPGPARGIACGFENPENQITLFRAIQRHLAEHLGGRRQG